MSANLLAESDLRTGDDGTTYADGVWSIPANGTSTDKNAVNDFPINTETVSGDQTLHVGLSIRAASEASVVIAIGVAYVDDAGDGHYGSTRISAKGTGAWQRVEGSIGMPSGMRVTLFFVHQGSGGAALELMAPTLSYRSPVSLAVASHTPYATEGHLQAKYASQEQLSSVSSQFTQTAQGFNASITTVTKALDDATGRISELKNLSDNMIGENGAFTKFYNSATSYMKFEYDENLNDSYLVLGQTDSTLSLRIGNDRIEFMDGPNVIAYVDGDKLFINNVQVVKRHMIADLEKNHGGFVFDTRDNGNMCVRWITG